MIKRIVVENGAYSCRNMGDVAMLQVVVDRLTALWPQATIKVLTTNPNQLLRFCPSVVPVVVDFESRRAWLSGISVLGRFRQKLPAKLSSSLEMLEEQFWLRFPGANDLCINLRARALGKPLPAPPARYRNLLIEADLVAICGGGFINDCFKESACDLLDELKAVLHAGVPVVAFGQGIGPITDPALEAKARAVLPHLKTIGLREGRSSLPLLESLGVPRDRIHVTGDDAIEPAMLRRPSSLGNAIGVNLRLADYAGTDETTADKLREPLRRAAQALNSSLIPVLISFHNVFHNKIDSDREAVGRLLDDGNQGSHAVTESPDDAIGAIGKCRVVVTGSYHGAVFALAQGIPVVGLWQSEYYEQKFTGLQQQFPGGCLLIDLKLPSASAEIEDAIHEAWESAERVRESLIEAAVRQVELGRALYQAAHALISLE